MRWFGSRGFTKWTTIEGEALSPLSPSSSIGAGRGRRTYLKRSGPKQPGVEGKQCDKQQKKDMNKFSSLHYLAFVESYNIAQSKLLGLEIHVKFSIWLVPGWCSTPTQLLICSSFNRENGHPLLICSSLSTAQVLLVVLNLVSPKSLLYTDRTSCIALIDLHRSWVTSWHRTIVPPN